MNRSKLSRILTLAIAIFVVASTLGVVANAAPTVLTPHKAYFTYKLSSGGYSSPITPASNTAVLVMGTQTASGYRGVGQVSMLHIPGQFLEWVGLESPSLSQITSNYSGTFGTHIVYLDYSSTVDLEVNSADSFLVHNANGSTATGTVTLIW